MKNSQKIKQKRKINLVTVQGKIAVVVCGKCKLNFGIRWSYIGIITCPYCGCYVEG